MVVVVSWYLWIYIPPFSFSSSRNHGKNRTAYRAFRQHVYNTQSSTLRQWLYSNLMLQGFQGVPVNSGRKFYPQFPTGQMYSWGFFFPSEVILDWSQLETGHRWISALRWYRKSSQMHGWCVLVMCSKSNWSPVLWSERSFSPGQIDTDFRIFLLSSAAWDLDCLPGSSGYFSPNLFPAIA